LSALFDSGFGQDRKPFFIIPGTKLFIQSSSLCALLHLRLDSGETVAFMFAFESPFNAAHRLICACRTRSRPSALILRRFLAF
jgi:hypothetical protein